MTTVMQRTKLPKIYAPADVEGRTYEMWEERGYFRPSEDPDREDFVITIPPPNVTGELHLGHALTYSIEDVLGRYKRMRGFSTLILPGSDHASIAVHAKIEAMLAEEGIRRRCDIGREGFVQRAWEWKEKYGAAITAQFRALGEGYDWTRERFTMDPPYYRAVLTMFVRLYDEGYIYRGSRVINWCPGCQTGISDIEVRPGEREDVLYFVRLPFDPSSGNRTRADNGIVVATVRPETMFGDVAVAVHPDDDRYRAVVGNHVRHPLTGHLIPIIADDFVDPAFGTGAVKITPAHDYADFEVGERHGLSMPVVITPHAAMAEDVPELYRGMSIEAARQAAVEELERQGLMVRTESLVHDVPLCDRCGSVIEPLLSEQWFMRMNELAEPAIEAVRSGEVTFVPERWGRIYLEWMDNIRPWNISRQLWWGQRIPIYHCSNGHVTASVDAPDACQECGSNASTQDPDVLDTWFSSSLWPFASLGWPDNPPDLERFYPTSFMNTSSQILYLWIARMIMMGIHFMGDVPFPVVLINPTILNEKGQRMSKSLGTGIDPLETVERYGADATRFAVLSAGSIIQQEIRISGYERAEEGQKFANKMWNAARFVLQNLSDEDTDGHGPASAGSADPGQLEVTDRWILSRMGGVSMEVTRSLETFDLTAGLRVLYDFFWSEFADWYLEIAKLRLRGDDDNDRATVRAVLWSVLDRSVRLLHPYMPFITEEIWQHLRADIPKGASALSGLDEPPKESIMIASWPTHEAKRDNEAEEDMQALMEIISGLRNLRAEHGVKPMSRLTAVAFSRDRFDLLIRTHAVIAGLAGLEKLELVDTPLQSTSDVAEVSARGATILIPLAQFTKVQEEIERVERELAKARAEAARIGKLLDNPNFAAKAPEPVVAGERQKFVTLSVSVQQLEKHLHTLRGKGN